MGKCKKHFVLREKYNEAVQNQDRFRYEIELYRRLLAKGNPLENGGRYRELLEALHEAEEMHRYWTMRASRLQYKMYNIEQHYYWNET